MKQQNGKQSLSGKAKVQFAMIFNSAAVLESELPTSVSVRGVNVAGRTP
jgi:hypothetical protein